MSRPAGVCGVPLGETAVCQAGTSLTQPQSNLTVPPRFGSRTSSTPLPPSSLASSTIATTVAPVRLAMSTVSPRWSAWPWVSRIASASTSSAAAAAFGLPDRNGSVSTVTPSALSSKQDWPSQRTSTAISFVSLVLVEHVRQLIPDRHADEHGDAGLLGDQPLHGILALVGVLVVRRLAHLGAVGGPEPLGRLERLLEDPLQLPRRRGDDALGLPEARGIAQRLDSRLDLGVGVRSPLGHAGHHRSRCLRP